MSRMKMFHFDIISFNSTRFDSRKDKKLKSKGIVEKLMTI